MSTSIATPTPNQILDALFPVPRNGSTSYGTTIHSGVSDETGKALVRLLKDDHERHHIFFNDRGFHK